MDDREWQIQTSSCPKKCRRLTWTLHLKSNYLNNFCCSRRLTDKFSMPSSLPIPPRPRGYTLSHSRAFDTIAVSWTNAAHDVLQALDVRVRVSHDGQLWCDFLRAKMSLRFSVTRGRSCFGVWQDVWQNLQQQLSSSSSSFIHQVLQCFDAVGWAAGRASGL